MIDDDIDILEPRHCTECDAELDELDPYWETSLCARCANEPTESEERRQWSDDDMRRRIRELSAIHRSTR